jgi:hypothetical protein
MGYAHVHLVDVRPLFPVNFYADECLIHQSGDSLVLKGLLGHDMAPVAGGVAHGEKDGLVFPFRCSEGFFAPGVPVHGVKGVLEEVGALFREETINWGFPFFRWRIIYHR